MKNQLFFTVLILLFFVCGGGDVSAQSRDLYKTLREQDIISKKYRRGPYFIYDCMDRHFACIDKDSYDTCKKDRDKMIEKKAHIFPCAPIKKFEDHDACKKSHYKQMHNLVPKDFCINNVNSYL